MTLPYSSIHFVGIGGAGMTGLALICQELGLQVSGSDEADSRNLLLLRQRGMRVRVGHAASQLKSADLVVYSSAVPADNAERCSAAERGIPQCRRGDFLAELAAGYQRVVGVAGSHGKSTVTAMLSHILIRLNRQPAYLVGGETLGRPAPGAAGCGDILVTELDESDGTQAAVACSLGIIVNAEDDHHWSAGGLAGLQRSYQKFGKKAAMLLAADRPETRRLFGAHPAVHFFSEGGDDPIRIPQPGAYNRFNAALAVEAAVGLGEERSAARATLADFPGVDRRMSRRYEGPGAVLIEDYAHHPTEVRVCLEALREAWPQRRLRVVFQPHRHERVARYGADFARELAKADEAWITPTFAAWLQDSDRGDPRRIAAEIEGIPAAFSDRPFAELAAELAEGGQAGDLIAVLGAGSITQLIAPLSKALQDRGL